MNIDSTDPPIVQRIANVSTNFDSHLTNQISQKSVDILENLCPTPPPLKIMTKYPTQAPQTPIIEPPLVATAHIPPTVGFGVTHKPSPVIDHQRRKVCVSSIGGAPKGGRFWIAARCGGKIVSAFLDSGAEVSIVPRRFVRDSQMRRLKEEVDVMGFKEDSTTVIKHSADVSLFFKPGLIRKEFYVLDVPHLIIGNDLLRDKTLKLCLKGRWISKDFKNFLG